jgi:hypothetical protein
MNRSVSRRERIGLIVPFLTVLLFGGWGIVLGVVTALAIVVPIVFSELYQPTMPLVERLRYIGVALFVLLFVKVLHQYWIAFASEDQRISVLSGRVAEEASPYEYVMELSVYPSAREEQLLTLFTESSGLPQPIGLLRVVDTRHAGKIIATPFTPVEFISKYFEEESRRKSLFALTTISTSSIGSTGEV